MPVSTASGPWGYFFDEVNRSAASHEEKNVSPRPAEAIDLRLTPLAAQPCRQRLPLVPVGPGKILRQLEDTEPARIRSDVVLRFAECSHVRNTRFSQVLVDIVPDQLVVAYTIGDLGKLCLLALDLADVPDLFDKIGRCMHVDRRREKGNDYGRGLDVGFGRVVAE